MPPASRFDDPEQLLADRAWLVRIAGALLGDRDEAEDVAQEAQLRAWSSPPRAGEERPWLRRVARNLALRLRSRREWRATWERRAARSEKLPSSDELVARVQAQRAVAEAVLALGEPYREVVLLRYFDDLRPAEIAARLATPVETVRTRLKRALAQLRARLDATHGGRDAWSALLAPWIGAAKAGGGVKALLAAGVLVAGVVAWRAVIEDGAATSPAAARELAPVVAAADPEVPASDHRNVAASARTGTGAVRSTDVVARGGLVHVVDGDGRSIEGAHLFVGPRDHAELQFATDAEGRSRLPDSVGEEWLAVAAPGFRSSEHVLGRTRAPDVEITLRRGTTIEGVVRTSDPIEPRAGLRVVAIAADDSCSVAHLESICVGRAPGPIVTTDALGTFVIDGLDPQTTYSIVAGGGGWVSLRSDPVAAGTKDLVVTVGALFGVDLQLCVSGDGALPSSDWFGPPRFTESGQSDCVADPFRPIVAGLPAEVRAWNRSHVLLLHVRESCADDRIGPYYHRTNEAGFASDVVGLHLGRFTDSVPVVRHELEPLPGVRFGRLAIEIRGEDAALEPGAGQGLLGVLMLIPPPELASGGFFEAGVQLGSGPHQVVSGVPVGKYAWRFLVVEGPNPPRPFGIDGASPSIEFDGDDATLVLDLRERGDVQFDVTRSDGSAFVGVASFSILDAAAAKPTRDVGSSQPVAVDVVQSSSGADSSLRRTSTLEGPPFVLRALRRGCYAVRVDSARSRRRAEPMRLDDLPIRFDVTAGAVTRCAVTVDD
ncbi:MAG TPA: sigma-70 family RNA polymerase sigma factor [Planctomycetota bacterium]|nr:sigma-70 family RNA polymerase sigma factor [Planctomycetota bacterium]